MKKIDKDILWRVYLIYLLVLIFGLAIIGRVCYIQFIEGDKWLTKAKELTIKYENIEAVRGNIFATDRSLLASSVPIFDIRMDAKNSNITNSLFNSKIDSLAYCLSNLFINKTKTAYKNDLLNARKKGNRYFLVKRNVTYSELKKLRKFPLFRKGQYQGGLIIIKKEKRAMPFKELAARTIGYERNGYYVGLEGAYSNQLQGVSGKRLMQKIANSVWIPVNSENEIEPKDGNDIVTTIDINIQDVAEEALKKQLIKHGANHGCAILMEVKTGHIKAIANLGISKNGTYYEDYNYAIGESSEPGSTFKLPSLMVALEDKVINLDDSVNTGNGVTRYYGIEMFDSENHGYGKISVQHAFEVSSNVGISKVIYNAYSKNPQKFIDGLYKLGLNKKLGVEIVGEGKPYIKSADDKDWSGISLPWMAHGYEVEITPLQLLTFYNAVANNGVMVKPMFVKEIRHAGKVIKSFEPHIINESICSNETIKKAKILLEGVVENGTARNLKNSIYKIAGKTGTAQIASGSTGYNKKDYKASFVGYFPADNPMYSCIVIINNPTQGSYYGSSVAGPVFKEIADKVYATQLNLHNNEREEISFNKSIPLVKSGNQSDIETIYKNLEFPIKSIDPDAEWVTCFLVSDSVKIKPKTINYKVMPNLIGWGVKDALFILENMGLKVKISGKGLVKHQSIKAGNIINKGDMVQIILKT